MKRYSIYLILFILLKPHYSSAQNIDSTNYKLSYKYITAIYNKTFITQNSIYYGKKHEGYPGRIKGSPYFSSVNWENGNLIFNGKKYENIAMRYDQVADQLVVQRPDSVSGIALSSHNIQEFFLQGHKFIRIDSDRTNILPPGFYDSLFSGKISILARRQKLILEHVSREVTKEFSQRDRLLIIKNNKVYKGNEGGILEAMADKKKEVKQFIRDQEINFRKDPEDSAMRVAQYYESL